jgi:hypothetical protein
MDPQIRYFVLLGGLLFCLVFGAMTAAVAAESGLDVLVITSFVVIGLVLVGVLGAIRNPPPDE